jgi:hypothetical protein
MEKLLAHDADDFARTLGIVRRKDMHVAEIVDATDRKAPCPVRSEFRGLPRVLKIGDLLDRLIHAGRHHRRELLIEALLSRQFGSNSVLGFRLRIAGSAHVFMPDELRSFERPVQAALARSVAVA